MIKVYSKSGTSVWDTERQPDDTHTADLSNIEPLTDMSDRDYIKAILSNVALTPSQAAQQIREFVYRPEKAKE
mgnify:CR=1 FL=1